MKSKGSTLHPALARINATSRFAARSRVRYWLAVLIRDAEEQRDCAGAS